MSKGGGREGGRGWSMDEEGRKGGKTGGERE